MLNPNLDEIQLTIFLFNEAKFSAPKISKILEINLSTAYTRTQHLKNNREIKLGSPKWSDEDKDKLWKLKMQGTSDKDLATIFNKSLSATKSIIATIREEKRLGLKEQ